MIIPHHKSLEINRISCQYDKAVYRITLLLKNGGKSFFQLNISSSEKNYPQDKCYLFMVNVNRSIEDLCRGENMETTKGVF